MLASSFCLLSQCGSQTPSLTSAVVLSSFLRLSDVAFSPCFWDLCSMLSSKSPPVASYQHKVPNFLALHDEDFSHLPSTSPLPYPLLHISTTKNLKNSSQSPTQSYTPMPPHMLCPLLGNLSTALLLLDNPNFFKSRLRLSTTSSMVTCALSEPMSDCSQRFSSSCPPGPLDPSFWRAETVCSCPCTPASKAY